MQTKKLTVKSPKLSGLIDQVVNLAAQGGTRCPKSVPRISKGGIKSVVMDVPLDANPDYEVPRKNVYGASVIIKAANPITFIDKIVKIASNGGVRATSITSSKGTVGMVVPVAPEKEPNLLVQPVSVDSRGKTVNEEDIVNGEEEQETATQDVEEGSEQDSEDGSSESEIPEEKLTTVEQYRYSKDELKDMDIGQLKSLCDERGLPRRKAKDKCIQEILNGQSND